MNETGTKIEISGKLNYSDDITINQAAQIITFLNADEGEAPRLGARLLDAQEKRDSTTGNSAKKVSSPREALETSGAQRNPEKIVALGAYVLQDGGDTFKTEDIKTQFRRARETPPANLTRDLGVAIASGWVIEDGDGEYMLHNKFDAIFDDGFTFPKATGSGRARAVKNPGSKPKAGKPESLNDVDAFHSVMPGYPAYSKLKTEKDRLMWAVVYMAENHGRVGLTNKEIDFITDEIGPGIPNAHIAGAFNQAKKQGYAFRSLNDKTIRVNDDGKAYLAKVGTKAEA